MIAAAGSYCPYQSQRSTDLNHWRNERLWPGDEIAPRLWRAEAAVLSSVQLFKGIEELLLHRAEVVSEHPVAGGHTLVAELIALGDVVPAYEALR